jgi:hypothetical protein
MQHGLRGNHSTETAAHSLVSFIESAFSEKKVCATAFLEIKSAAWQLRLRMASSHTVALADIGCPS